LDLAILIGALLLASGCATPVGVVRGNPQSVYRALTSSVLSTGEPSASTAQVLHRRGLAERFDDEPEAVLTELRGTGNTLSRACRRHRHLLMVMGTPTWDTSVTVIWKSWYKSLKPFRFHVVSATA
jgi:hypothetical protein